MLDASDTHRKSHVKTERSTDEKVVFQPADFAGIFRNRQRGASNRVRVVVQGPKAAFTSPEFLMSVGTKITADKPDASRVKIAATIDEALVPSYAFVARLAVWGSAHGKPRAPFSYGGEIHGSQGEYRLEPNVRYDFSSAKLFYLGPDDAGVVRTELSNFGPSRGQPPG